MEDRLLRIANTYTVQEDIHYAKLDLMQSKFN